MFFILWSHVLAVNLKKFEEVTILGVQAVSISISLKSFWLDSLTYRWSIIKFIIKKWMQCKQPEKWLRQHFFKNLPRTVGLFYVLWLCVWVSNRALVYVCLCVWISPTPLFHKSLSTTNAFCFVPFRSFRLIWVFLFFPLMSFGFFRSALVSARFFVFHFCFL